MSLSEYYIIQLCTFSSANTPHTGMRSVQYLVDLMDNSIKLEDKRCRAELVLAAALLYLFFPSKKKKKKGNKPGSARLSGSSPNFYGFSSLDRSAPLNKVSSKLGQWSRRSCFLQDDGGFFNILCDVKFRFRIDFNVCF